MHRSPIARLLWCALGAAVGIALSLFLVAPPASPFFFASLGGSAVFLFGLTRAPAAQPRALFGGHLGGALIGIACYQLLGDSLWVYVVAQVLVLWYMLITKTVHPPAGAEPYHHDLRPLQSIRALAAGFSWRAQPGRGGSHMEPPVSGPLALSCCLARPLPAVLILGRLE